MAERLESFQMRCLRVVLGITKFDRKERGGEEKPDSVRLLNSLLATDEMARICCEDGRREVTSAVVVWLDGGQGSERETGRSVERHD